MTARGQMCRPIIDSEDSVTARGQMCRPIDALLTDGQWHGQSHPAAHPSVHGLRTECVDVECVLGWMQADQLKVRCHRPSGHWVGGEV